MALQLNRSGKDTSAAIKPGTGKPAKGAPVTAHPLFPAVVALWFGALFGLGSLAVRVGLLESLVLASRIDTLIPAAAPPLGISARILLALTLAALGALLGAGIARRIAAPKPVVRERKRKAALSPEESVNLRSRDTHPDAPARRPLSINDALGDGLADSDQIDQAAADPLAGRRRSALAVETDDTFELHELAPLPGGNPQILPLSHNADAQAGQAPLELGDYAEASEHHMTAPTLDWHNAASSAAPMGHAPQVFPGEDMHAAEPLPNFSPPSDAVSGRQVFGMTHPQPDEVLDELGITDAEFEPLPAAEPAPTVGRDHGFDQAVAPTAPEAPIEAAARFDAADSATMPMTDLAQRLAESMERRRARAAQTAEAAAAPVVVAPVVVAPEAETDAVADAGADAPISFAKPAEPISFERLGANPDFTEGSNAAPDFAHPNDIPFLPVPGLPSATALASADQPAPAHVAGLNFAAPPVAEPVAAAPGLAIVPPQLFGNQQQAVPAALRPLSFDAFSDDDDGDDLGGFLPPRSFPGVGRVMPVPAAPAAPFEAPPEPAQNPFAAESVDETDEPAADDKFSSLLDLGRSAEPRQTFVRIEDVAEPAAAIEPVVIFPGQVARPAAAPAVPTEFDPAAASFRQFDSPSSADAGQGVAPATSTSHDQGETERALRAALANLQRMSGAA